MDRAEEDRVLAQAQEIKARRAREGERRTEPPFDGKACPMCPGAIRNLSAVVHNFLWRWETGGSSPCKAQEKFGYVSMAVAEVAPLITADTHDAVRTLHEAAADFVNWWGRVAVSTNAESRAFAQETLRERGQKLKAASLAIEPLSAAHFADRLHSHGEIR